MCSKTYFTFDASILRRLAGGAERTRWRSGTQRICRISGPGCPRRNYDAIRRYSNTAGWDLDSDYSESDTRHRPGIKLSQSADARQQYRAFQRKSERSSYQPRRRPLRNHARSNGQLDSECGIVQFLEFQSRFLEFRLLELKFFELRFVEFRLLRDSRHFDHTRNVCDRALPARQRIGRTAFLVTNFGG